MSVAQKLLKEKYSIYHFTIQVEPYHRDMESCKECFIPGEIQGSKAYKQ